MKEDWIYDLSKIFFKPSIELTDIDDAIELKYKNIPNSLYKFRNISEYSIQNLKDDTIWCSNASEFNDPYDSSLCFDFDFIQKDALLNSVKNLLTDRSFQFPFQEDFLSRQEKTSDPYRALIQEAAQVTNTNIDLETEEQLLGFLCGIEKKYTKEIVENFNHNLKNGYKICSFSERIDSVLMWSHYSNYHKGFAIEYNFAELSIKDVRTRFLWPVVYDNMLFDATGYLKEQKESGTFNSLLGIIASIHKAKDWEYENEWRLVVPMSPSDPPMNYQVPKPKAIYLGSKIDKSLFEKLKSIARGKGITVYRMNLAHNEFKMTSELIE